MARKKRSELDKRKKKKPKHQGPPPAPAVAREKKSRKRRRNASGEGGPANPAQKFSRVKRRKEQFEVAKKKKSKEPTPNSGAHIQPEVERKLTKEDYSFINQQENYASFFTNLQSNDLANVNFTKKKRKNRDIVRAKARKEAELEAKRSGKKAPTSEEQEEKDKDKNDELGSEESEEEKIELDFQEEDSEHDSQDFSDSDYEAESESESESESEMKKEKKQKDVPVPKKQTEAPQKQQIERKVAEPPQKKQRTEQKPKIVEKYTKHTLKNTQENVKGKKSHKGPKEETLQKKDWKLKLSLKKYTNKQEAIGIQKKRMALLGSSLLEDPETNFGLVREILEMCQSEFLTIRKLALLSLLAIYSDTLPDYRIVPHTADEMKGNKVSKDTKKIWEYEAIFLSSYQSYLKLLEAAVKQPGTVSTERKTAVKCLCKLLVQAPYFNFTANIIAMVVPLMDRDNDQYVSSQCCKAIRSVFENDTRGHYSLQIVKLVGKYIQQKSFNTNVEVLNTFLGIKFTDSLKEGEVTLDPVKQHLTRKQKNKMSSKQYQDYKEMKKVESEMQKVAAEQNEEERHIIQTDILRAVFVSYFRILKKSKNSPLLPAVLDGLARYAKFINIDFIDDIVTALRDLVKSDDSYLLPVPTRLKCAVSALEMVQSTVAPHSMQSDTMTEEDILKRAINVDLKELYGRLYEVLVEIPSFCASNPQIIESLIRCLKLLINDKKQVSSNRMAAFAKRIMYLSLHLPPNAILAMNSLLFLMLQRHPQIQQMLESEQIGSGKYLPEVPDPEYCNALASSFWEFSALSGHYHPKVREFAKKVVDSFDEDGITKSALEVVDGAEELYNRYNCSKGGFNPPIPIPPPHPLQKIIKKRSKEVRQKKRKYVGNYFIATNRKEDTPFIQQLKQTSTGVSLPLEQGVSTLDNYW
eukprot:CAMPEP_0174260724 /NCGR_PEP_ID=MMETSP0439-20130205/10371_1 /TAXON_ID=0 /ORGANISM="Stereomyxa ramosa, Strain Chinc5" /LENGTH=919 /DNA_ID=CAMNT_0015345031 /DNA_START=28 /DNA_END=2784 /DNA_ORIENTATION=-